mgnify:CR=1 FL=1
MAPIIALERVARTFRAGAASARVLGPVDLEVRTGELTLVMGPSGSGKSTLLSILGLLLTPTEGRVVLAGEDVSRLGERARGALRARHVAFVFQQFHLVRSLTAAENVQMALALGGLHGAAARRRARELLARVGLEGRADARPRDLSGGQMQRVGIARALALPGRLLLADEPTANLDSASGENVMSILGALAVEEDRAVVVVTHDVRWRTPGRRLLHLEDGRFTSPEESDHEAARPSQVIPGPLDRCSVPRRERDGSRPVARPGAGALEGLGA